jgi:hypothetical protein
MKGGMRAGSWYPKCGCGGGGVAGLEWWPQRAECRIVCHFGAEKNPESLVHPSGRL